MCWSSRCRATWWRGPLPLPRPSISAWLTRGTPGRQKWSFGSRRGLRFALLSRGRLPLWAAAEEVIEDFAVTLQVQADGNLLVTERITVQAEGEQIKRGIYRDLPVRYAMALGLNKSGPISLLGVSSDGQPERVTTERIGAWVRYYIGSADHRLQPGRYQYELRYRVERQLLHHQGRDELYWNVTGNQWGVPRPGHGLPPPAPPGPLRAPPGGAGAGGGGGGPGGAAGCLATPGLSAA